MRPFVDVQKAPDFLLYRKILLFWSQPDWRFLQSDNLWIRQITSLAMAIFYCRKDKIATTMPFRPAVADAIIIPIFREAEDI